MADAPAAGSKGKVENAVMQLVITLVTCGIYGVYWAWVRTKELNAYLGKEAVNPLLIFPGCLCWPVMVVGLYFLAKAAAEAEMKAGTTQKDDTIIYFILLFLVNFVGVWMVQEKLNAVWQKA